MAPSRCWRFRCRRFHKPDEKAHCLRSGRHAGRKQVIHRCRDGEAAQFSSRHCEGVRHLRRSLATIRKTGARAPLARRTPEEFISPADLRNQVLQIRVEWELLYSEDFTDAEKQKIIGSLKKAMESSDCKVEKVWGEVIEDRGSQITFSALGQQAPLEEKKKWDPDFAKRKKMKAAPR